MYKPYLVSYYAFGRYYKSHFKSKSECISALRFLMSSVNVESIVILPDFPKSKK